MAIILRTAVPDDVPALLRLIRGLAEYEKLGHTVEATEARLMATLFPAKGIPAATCLLAVDGSTEVGYALTFTTYSTFLAKPGLWLEDLFVVPDRRGQGVGKSLLVELARRAADEGYGRLEWTVLDWNSPAIEFYRRVGADILPDWRVCRLTGAALQRYSGHS